MKKAIINNLKSKKFRITKTRESLTEIITTATRPLSPSEILEKLRNDGINIHKTTLYRELDFFLEQRIIKVIQFVSEREKRYELSGLKHHHHVICTDCGMINDVFLPEIEKKLEQAEKYISKKQNIQLNQHSLEFLGLCNKCK